MVETYRTHYDKEADFLEIFFGEPTSCYAEEPEPGIFVRKDERTDEVKSIGILGFKTKAKALKKLLVRYNKDFPLTISVMSLDE